MATEVLAESYVMATGYAALMGADSERQHLFARHYDQPVTVAKLANDWGVFTFGMAVPPSDRERGLYPKYRVFKLDGKPMGDYFVLEESDPNALAALLVYAAWCRGDYPLLAEDLKRMVRTWSDKQQAAGGEPQHADGCERP